jgi:post-segregation antitoxin (ccd killing protein)
LPGVDDSASPANFRDNPAHLASVISARYHDNMIRTQISVDDDLYRRAKVLARRDGISLAELCRRSLQAAVAKQPSDKPWMAFAGIVEGSPSDSESVDDVLYGRETP